MNERYVDFENIDLPYIKCDVAGIETDGESLTVRIIYDENNVANLHWKSYYHFNSSDEDSYLKLLGQIDRDKNILVEVDESESLRKLKEILEIPEKISLHHYMVFGSCYVINVYSKEIPCLITDNTIFSVGRIDKQK